MNQVNYQKKLDEMIGSLTERGETPSLLLHSCCAPCSSYVIEALADYFKITVFYFNPNISPGEEYQKRVTEQKRFLSEIAPPNPVAFLEGEYRPERFFAMARGMESLPEGGERCFHCYEQRLRETALTARAKGFDYFGTTLSVSPYKNAQKLNEIGAVLAGEYGVPYLFSDFKKKGGYLRSIELSKQYGLYRQNYCGCVYSKRESETEREGESNV